MKWIFIYISVLLFVFGCGDSAENPEVDTVNQEDAPNVIFVKTPSERNDLELMDEQVDIDGESVGVAKKEESSEETQIASAFVEEKSPEEQKASEEEQVEVASAEADPEETKVVVQTVLEEAEQVAEVSAEEADEEEAEQIEVIVYVPEEAEAEEEETAVSSEPSETVEVAIATSSALTSSVCRGTLAQLKNSCEFMPKWLNDIQASGEDVTISRGKHGIVVTWNNGVFENGTFVSGLWRNGVFKDGIVKFIIWDQGIWEGGEWQRGLWNGGTCQAEDCSHAE